MTGKLLIRSVLRAIVLVILCVVIVDVTQTLAMFLVVGAHELGHAVIGLIYGESLAGVPIVNIGLTPLDISGLTTFTDSSRATASRVFAGPYTNLVIGVVISLMLIPRLKILSKIRLFNESTYAGFFIEALTLVLFWSGYAIVTQFIGFPGSDLGNASPNQQGQAILFICVLFGMSIMISLLFGRIMDIVLMTGIIKEVRARANRRYTWIRYPIYLALSILVVLFMPVPAWGLIGMSFMLVSLFYYMGLLLTDRYDIARIGADLNTTGIVKQRI
jgi:hypothetical protein